MTLLDPTASLALGPGRGLADGTARAWTGRDGRPDRAGGLNSRSAKLTADEVRAIRARPLPGDDGATRASLGAEFGVSRSCVANIRARRTYRDIT